MTTADTTQTAPKTRKARKTTSKRDDVHRPGAIDPSEYKYLFSFSRGTYGMEARTAECARAEAEDAMAWI